MVLVQTRWKSAATSSSSSKARERALERQIGTRYYERLLASADQASVVAEAQQNLAALPATPRQFVRDPVQPEFLGLPDTGRFSYRNFRITAAGGKSCNIKRPSHFPSQLGQQKLMMCSLDDFALR